jgi:D-amino-acid dehydrogenase
MRVAVIGAGVVGVATAYYLAEDGHEVTLIDRRDKAAVETSFGNAGLYSPSDAYAWASPDALKMAIRSLYRSDLGIKYKLRLDPRLWLWSLKFLTQCTHKAAHRNTLLKLRLLSYSKDRLDEVVAATGVEYDGLKRGILYYFRSAEGLKAAGQHMSILRDNGIALEIVDRDRMIELEPVMANAPEVAGAIYSPDCQTGDSHRFANGLAAWCVAHRGVTAAYGTRVDRLVVIDGRVIKALTSRGEIAADAFVIAAGAESVFLTEAIGMQLPIYPVKGFSITAPLRDPAAGPTRGLVDEDRLVAMSPFGDRLRAASSAVFDGYGTGHRPENFASILETVGHLYGEAVDLGDATYWAGLRPMTPTSVPIMGPSRYADLFLNVGHGHVGWSMSCGAGRFVADWVSGRKTAIDGEGYLIV